MHLISDTKIPCLNFECVLTGLNLSTSWEFCSEISGWKQSTGPAGWCPFLHRPGGRTGFVENGGIQVVVQRLLLYPFKVCS